MWVRRWIRAAEIIDRLDQPPFHQLTPEAIHSGPREPGVRGRGEPVRQYAAPIHQGPDSRLAALEKPRAHDLLCLGMPVLLIEGQITDLLGRRRPPPLAAQLGEECRQGDEILPLPLLRRVVVATRAFDAEPQKRLRCQRGQILGGPG